MNNDFHESSPRPNQPQFYYQRGNFPNEICSEHEETAIQKAYQMKRKSRSSQSMQNTERRISEGDEVNAPLLSREPSLNLEPESSGARNKLRHVLIKFYEVHNPSAIERVDEILDTYKGREHMLWIDLEEKYGEIEEGKVQLRMIFMKSINSCIFK